MQSEFLERKRNGQASILSKDSIRMPWTSSTTGLENYTAIDLGLLESICSLSTDSEFCAKRLSTPNIVRTGEPRDGIEASSYSASLTQEFLKVAEASITPKLRQMFHHAQREEIGCGINHVDVHTGMRLRYIERNHSGVATVLMLHDLAEQSTVFIKIGKELEKVGFRILAIDLRGHGRSSHPTDKSAAYSLDWLVEDVMGFILALNLYSRPIIVLGKGLGGVIASYFATRHPQLVGCLIILDPIHDTCKSLGYFVGQAGIFPSVESACLFGLEYFNRWKSQYPIQACKRIIRVLRERNDKNGFEYPLDSEWWYTNNSCVDQSLRNGLDYIRDLSTGLPTLVLGPEKSSTVNEINDFGANQIQVTPLLNFASGLEDEAAVVSLSSIIAKFVFNNGSCIDVGDGSARLPERLGLKTLCSFGSLEEAQKALGPRKIPDDSAIEFELAKLREDEEEEEKNENDIEISFNHRTALIKDDPEYFGFLG